MPALYAEGDPQGKPSDAVHAPDLTTHAKRIRQSPRRLNFAASPVEAAEQRLTQIARNPQDDEGPVKPICERAKMPDLQLHAGHIGAPGARAKVDTGERAGTIHVRLAAGRAYSEATVGLCALAHAESGFAAIPFDGDKVRALADRYTGQPGTYCVLLAERNGEAVGLLAGAAQEYLFSRERAASAIIFFVKPASRGGLSAIKLLHAFRRWAAQRGAQGLLVHVTSGVQKRRTDRLLRRLGFAQTGGNYMLGLAGQAVAPLAPSGMVEHA